MTPLVIKNRKTINLDAVTFVEETMHWRSPAPDCEKVPCLRVHFIGGSFVDLIGAEADEMRRQMLLAN